MWAGYQVRESRLRFLLPELEVMVKEGRGQRRCRSGVQQARFSRSKVEVQKSSQGLLLCGSRHNGQDRLNEWERQSPPLALPSPENCKPKDEAISKTPPSRAAVGVTVVACGHVSNL